MKNKIFMIAAVAVLAVGAGAFYGGMKYQQSQIPQRGNFSAQGNLTGQRQGGAGNFQGAAVGAMGDSRNGGGIAAGEIIAKDEKSITVKLGEGGSKIVFYSSSTQIQKMTDAAQDELAVGKQVMAAGAANSDGSIVAKSIQLRPGVQTK